MPEDVGAPAIRVVGPGAGEVVGDAPDRRVEILAEHDALHVTWSRFGAGRDGADLHVHVEHSDAFYVLDGRFTLRLGPAGVEHVLPAGRLAWMPPGVVHGFRNAGDGELRYLNLHAPGRGFAAYMRGLRDGDRRTFDQHDPPQDGGHATTDAVVGAGALRQDELRIRRVTLAPGERAETYEAGAVVCRYVLDGTVEVEGERAPTGAWVEAPAGLRHTVAAADGAPAAFVEVVAPGR